MRDRGAVRERGAGGHDQGALGLDAAEPTLGEVVVQRDAWIVEKAREPRPQPEQIAVRLPQTALGKGSFGRRGAFLVWRPDLAGDRLTVFATWRLQRFRMEGSYGRVSSRYTRNAQRLKT